MGTVVNILHDSLKLSLPVRSRGTQEDAPLPLPRQERRQEYEKSA